MHSDHPLNRAWPLAAIVLAACGSVSQDPVDCGTGAPRWEVVELPENLDFQFGQYPAEIIPGGGGFAPDTFRYGDGAFWYQGRLILWNGVSGAIWNPTNDVFEAITTFDNAGDLYGQFVGLAGGQLLAWGVPWSTPSSDVGILPQYLRGWIHSPASGWHPMAPVPDTAGQYVGSVNPEALWGTHGNEFYYIASSSDEGTITQSASQLLSYDVSADTWSLLDNPAGITGQSVVVPMDDQLVVETPSVYTDASHVQQVELWTELNDQLRQWTQPIMFDPRTDIYDSRVSAEGDVLVWPSSGNPFSDHQGWAYSPDTRSMRRLSTNGAPTGGTMYAAGGQAVVASDGWYLYDPPSDTWARLPDQCAPSYGPMPRLGPGFAVWTDYGLLVWNLDQAKHDRRGEGRLLILDPEQSWGGK